MKVSPAQLWQQSLQLIKGNVSEQQFETWFKPIVFVSYSPATMTILVQVPSPFVYEYLEENFVDLIGKALKRYFGQKTKLKNLFHGRMPISRMASSTLPGFSPLTHNSTLSRLSRTSLKATAINFHVR